MTHASLRATKNQRSGGGGTTTYVVSAKEALAAGLREADQHALLCAVSDCTCVPSRTNADAVFG